jgi:hypothetical protein
VEHSGRVNSYRLVPETGLSARPVQVKVPLAGRVAPSMAVVLPKQPPASRMTLRKPVPTWPAGAVTLTMPALPVPPLLMA